MAALTRLPADLSRRVRRASTRCALAAAARPRRALILWALVTLLPLPGLLLLEIDTDGHALVPRDHPVVAADEHTRRLFGLHDPLFVVLDSGRPGGILDPLLLSQVTTLSETLQELPGIAPESVISLATERRDHLVPGSHDSFVPFLTPPPDNPRRLSELARDLEKPAARIYRGTLVSPGLEATAVLAGVADTATVDRRHLYGRVARRVAESTPPAATWQVFVVGAPAAEALLGDHILADLALLIPLASLLLIVVLWIGARRLAAVLLVLGKALLCVVWTLGLLGSLGLPVYLTVAVLPVVLITMSLADEIHLLMAYQRELLRSESPRRALHRTLHRLTTPVVLATSTAAVGFLTFLPSPIVPLRVFGFAAAAGIGYCLGFSLVATPALLAALPARWLRPVGRLAASPGPAGMRSVRWLVRLAERPAPTLVGIVLISALALGGVGRLTVQDSWIESFSRHSPLRRATERTNRLLAGTHLLRLHLTFRDGDGRGPIADWADPEALSRLGELERYLARQPEVGGASGLHSQLTALSHFWAGAGTPPAALTDRRQVLRLLNRYESSPGLTRRRQVATDSFDETVVTVFLENANYRDTASLMRRIEDEVGSHLGPLSVELTYAGDVAVSQATIPAIVRSQLLSLPLALLGVLSVIALLYGSLRMGLVALLPITVGALWLLGGMGWLGVPLGIATSTFFSIVIGVGVDSQSIHFLHRYRLQRTAGAAGAVGRTLREVVPAIAVNTLAVAAGFGLLAFSAVPANARLGLLLSLALTVGALLCTAGLGALLELVDRRPAKAGRSN